MTNWSKDDAIAELETLIRKIDSLHEERRHSAQHIRWLTRTLTLLEEVFGLDSKYLLSFTSIPWGRAGTFVIGGRSDPMGTLDPRAAIEREHQEAYQDQLESARGLLLAAVDHLRRVDSIAEVYEGRDTAPEASAILRVLNLAERRLRKAVRERPTTEREVQDALENLLIGADIQYKREKERIEYSSKTYTPDFTFPKLDLALDLKFCGSENTEKRLIKEINDYIIAFGTGFRNLIFIVYDVGFIRDVDRFVGSFEEHPDRDVVVRVVKH